MKTTLVTGGAGAIGSYLVNELCKTDSKIIVIDDLSSGYLENLTQAPNLEFIHASILDVNALDTVFSQEIETVFHLAANFANQNSVDFPEKDLLTNGLGTLRLLEYSHKSKVKRFVYTSSSCVYGNRGERLSESCKEFSLDTPYGITKLLGERYVNYFHEHHNLPTTIVRYFNTYGPGEFPGKYRNVIPNFFFNAIKKQSLVITGTGNETRDFNFIADSVNGTLLAAKKENAVGKTYNLASGRQTKIIDLANMINELTGNPAPVQFVQKRSWDSIEKRCAEIDLARKDLNYDPQVSLNEGLDITYQWLKNQSLDKYRL
ncbi:MAG: NAD-dependent epimerase/dehydratase family protein [Nitrospinales bacterium]